jgi:cytochrome c peroxidase
MIHLRHYFPIVPLAVLPLVLFVDQDGSTAEPAPIELRQSYRQVEPISPLPHSVVLPADKVVLGERLFHDARLSRNDTISCATCHDLARGGTDRRRFSLGIDGRVGTTNAPTVFNSGFDFVQFWDGRATSLEDQVAGPIHNPLEMASTWDQILAKLRADDDYRTRFAASYTDGITAANVANAIATFERSLVTPDSPFDRYLRGDSKALTADQREGYRRFKDLGCSSCHQGVNIGGNLFQRFGVMRDYFAGRTSQSSADQGRYNVTGREEDRHVFKVPSLRNVALTPPYFHDGSAATLEEAVAVMGRVQLDRELTDDDKRLLVAFLHSLTGKWQGKPLQ